SLIRARFLPLSRPHRPLHSFPTRRSSDLAAMMNRRRFLMRTGSATAALVGGGLCFASLPGDNLPDGSQSRNMITRAAQEAIDRRSEEHTSELQSRENLVCRLLLEKKKKTN